MSIKRVVKLLSDIGDVARKYSKADNPLFREATRELGEEIQDRLIEGFSGGYDINGHPFKKLKPATVKKKGHSEILIDSHALQNFIKSDALIRTGTLQVLLNKPPEEYMTGQNEGMPHKNVPSRKWYGIPKTYQEGGTKYNKFLNKLVDAYNDIFNTAIKKG